jgi:signal transduction histidine kinase
MTLDLHRQPSNLPQLKILEWVLLVIMIGVEIMAKTIYSDLALLPLNLLLIVVFAGLGWITPQTYLGKIIFTAVEFGSILFLALVGKLPLFALLLVVLVIRNCWIFEGRAQSIVTGLSFLFYVGCYHRSILSKALVGVQPDQVAPLLFGPIIIFGLTILFLQLFVSTVIAERQSRQELALANDRLQQYALKVEELATSQERNRIAREIHDSLGHTLTVFNFHLTAALRLFHSNPSKAEALLLEVKELGDSALAAVSESVASLRQDPLAGKSLGVAIGDLVEKCQQTTGVLPYCEIHIQPDLANRYKTAIYRIVQESLTNMCKYAAMTEAEIRVEQTAESISVVISDNGRGFDLAKNTTGFGLQGMDERVMLLSGKLEIMTAPNWGCRIIAILPLE